MKKTCHIVDFQISDSTKSFKHNFKTSRFYFAKKYGLSKISLWCNDPNFLSHLKKMGFEKISTPMHLIIKYLDDSTNTKIFNNFNNWNIRMADL